MANLKRRLAWRNDDRDALRERGICPDCGAEMPVGARMCEDCALVEAHVRRLLYAAQKARRLAAKHGSKAS